MDENRAIFTDEFKNAVITVLSSLRDDVQGNSLMRNGMRGYAINRISKAIRTYDRGFITAVEALEIGINPLKPLLDESGKVQIEYLLRSAR